MIRKSIIFSLLFQFIIIVISFYFLNIQVKAKYRVLQDILLLENIVQIIEFLFYFLILLYFYDTLQKVDIAKYRYIDWVITTPTMILSTILFFRFNNINNDKNNSEKLSLESFVNSDKENILLLFFLNFMMLFFGFLNEINIIDIFYSTIFGFFFFYLLFFNIYKLYAKYSSKNYFIFFFMTFVWGLYGISAIFNNNIKNTFYNILDIISKNFYALYLSYIIYNL